MSFTEKELNEFLKSNPQHGYLLEFYKEELEKKNKQIQTIKETFGKIKNAVVTTIVNFLKSSKLNLSRFSYSLRNFKFRIEVLEEDEKDYQLLNNALKNETEKVKMLGTSDACQKKIARIVPIKKRKIEDGEASNLLLLHGTRAKNVMGILKEDFIPSKKGKHGPGVYHTNNHKYASMYSENYIIENSTLKRVSYLFVNKVKETEALKTPRKFFGENVYDEYLKQKPVLQVFSEKTGNVVAINNNLHFKTDEAKNKLIGGKFDFTSCKTNIFLAHHELVVPAYLIEIKKEVDIKKFVSNALYNWFISIGLKQFVATKPVTGVKKMNIKYLKEYIENELNANHNEELKYTELKFNYKMRSTLQQINFKLTDISDIQNDKSNKYTIKKLSKEHKDYQFVMRSISIESVGLVPNVLHMYAIDCKAKSEEIKGSRLYAHGVKSDKIKKILTSGYDCQSWSSRCFEDCDFCELGVCAKHSTPCFLSEVEKSNRITRTFNINMKIQRLVNKNLAYVFLVAGKDKSIDKNVVTDSRGCHIKNGTLMPLVSATEYMPVVETIPTYLLVVLQYGLGIGLAIAKVTNL